MATGMGLLSNLFSGGASLGAGKLGNVMLASNDNSFALRMLSQAAKCPSCSTSAAGGTFNILQKFVVPGGTPYYYKPWDFKISYPNKFNKL